LLDDCIHRDSPGTTQPHSSHPWLLFSALTLAIVALNALKPLHIDDTYFYYQAKHIAANPLNPLDVEIFWFQWPRLATESTVPPVGPYWLAIGIRLFGEQPLLWKLWFSPFVFVFVVCVYALMGRFAPRLKSPLTVMVVLAPAFLPSWNLMLDMPTLTLTLASLVLFMGACDGRSRAWVISSGLVAGLAMQTKYTGAIAPAVVLVYAFVYRRMDLGLIAATLAATLFSAWECLLFLLYGHSQFIWSLKYSFPEAWDEFVLAKGLFMTVGGTSVCSALIAMVGLKLPRGFIILSMAAVIVGYGLIAVTPVERVVFTAFGATVGLATLAAFLHLLCFQASSVWKTREWRSKREELFLGLWLALEIAGYFFISPFCAVRRILGVVMVIMLIAGRSASMSWRGSEKGNLTLAVVALGTVLGLGYSVLDIREARVIKSAAIDAARVIREQDAEAHIWYVGHWGFAYYADQAGMEPVVPDNSLLRAGDWLVVPNRIERQEISFNNVPFQLRYKERYDDGLKVQSVTCFYAGIVPLEHRVNPRLEVYLFRVMSDYVPRTAWLPTRVAEWVRKHKATAWSASALPYLIKGLRYGDANVRTQMAEAIGELGDGARAAIPELTRCLDDRNAEVRRAASLSLKRVGYEEAGTKESSRDTEQ